MNTHVNPGCDVTVDPRPPIDDSFRSRKKPVNEKHPKRCETCRRATTKLLKDFLRVWVCPTLGVIDDHRKETIWVVGCATHSEKIEESEQRAGERG